MKMRLAVPTNSVSASARPFLDRHQLARFFEVSVTGDEIERGKPQADTYLWAVERRGVPPDACLVIEDALPDIAAKAAKMHVAAIPDRCLSIPRVRERSGLYLLGCPAEMAALINSFISQAANIAVFHNRKAAPFFQHRRCLQIEDRQCRNQVAELLMKVDKTLGIRKLADVEQGFDGKDLKHHAQTEIIVRLICCRMKVCLDHLSFFVATHS